MGLSEAYVPVENDKVSGPAGPETPMELLNDRARTRQAGVTANKIGEAKGTGAIVDLSGLAYSLVKYNLIQLRQAENSGDKHGQKFLTEQKNYIKTETLTLSKDEILETHKHLRHFIDLPVDQAISLTSLLVSQFGLAQFIACKLLQAYAQGILGEDDFLAAAEFFTYLSYLKNLAPLEQKNVNFDQKIYESFMRKDKKFIDQFRLHDSFIRLVYELKVQVSSDYQHLEFRQVPFAEVQEKFAQALKLKTQKHPEFTKFLG